MHLTLAFHPAKSQCALPLALLLLTTTALVSPASLALAQSLPTGGRVAAGTVSLAQPTATSLSVTQTSQSAVVNWQGFSIGQGYSVTIQQPNASAALLNRVTGDTPSTIAGSLTANGQVYLVNPNGIAITSTGTVNAGGGFAASTLGVSDADFMAGVRSFTGNGASASVSNAGVITVGRGGYAALIGGTVSNGGQIIVPMGKVALGSGEAATLDFSGDGFLQVTVPTTANGKGALIQNAGSITADGGSVIISAATARDAARNAVNISGLVQATTIEGRGGAIIIGGGNGAVSVAGRLTASAGKKDGRKQGKAGTIAITGDMVQLTGPIDVAGATGGSVRIAARSVASQSAVDVSGDAGAGGSYTVTATGSYIETSQSTVNASGASAGGSIAVQAKNIFSSGREDVTASGGTGGSISLFADTINLVSAVIDASGATGGGKVRIGGDFQGGGALAHAGNLLVSSGTVIKADAIGAGDGGSIVAWSDLQTLFYGAASARGGANGGNGGLIEVSSKEKLVMGGTGDAAAPRGLAGTLLLDPKNIVIDDAFAIYPQYELIDPNPADGNQFGSGNGIIPLASGNVVVTATADDFGASNAGAVYLFNRTTGALISTLVGSTANDYVGSHGVTALTNGNYVVDSPKWSNGTDAPFAGAVTWGSGLTGVGGVVSEANSLVGSRARDYVGSSWGMPDLGNVIPLTNGNYVVNSSSWANGAGAPNAGAVTWGSGLTGVRGVVSEANSLVGSRPLDYIGSYGVVSMTNGNYVVKSPQWANGDDGSFAGAVTWGSGLTGVRGVVSEANSLVGAKPGDHVGFSDITELPNGNFVVTSFDWGNGAGAVTWGSGASGVSGVVSAANSLVGSTANDRVGVTGLGDGGITALTNGNYVVKSPYWSNGAGAPNAGAVTWGSGASGVRGVVSAANSLVGSTANDSVGNWGVTALANGNYVVNSGNWSNGAEAPNAGAVTWGSGATGISGVVSAANSLVGSRANDQVGSYRGGSYSRGYGVSELTNGNYVVGSSNWANGDDAPGAGAATWGSGVTGVQGVVSAANSLVGSKAGDHVGNGIFALTNGNYVVSSDNWSNGAGAPNAGAVTWGSGLTGVRGVVSEANSLVGSRQLDYLGSSGVVSMTNGNYLVMSPQWSNGAGAPNAGAVTWGSGLTGVRGVVSEANSLVGSTANDQVGGVALLANGNYVVVSANWANGAEAPNAGAVTWVSGATGMSGVVSAANSLVGSRANDQVGLGGTVPLANGNYVVSSVNWSNGAGAPNAGAVTWGSGLTGVRGVVSEANSLVGSKAGASLDLWYYDLATDTILAASGGRVYVGVTNLNALTFNLAQTQTVTISSDAVTSVLNAGTNLVLQASNDITVSSAIAVNNPRGNGGDLTLQAGHSVFVNAEITTDNGNLTFIGNEYASNGVVEAERNTNAAAITRAPGAVINTGSGKLSLILRGSADTPSASKPNTTETAKETARQKIDSSSRPMAPANDSAPAMAMSSASSAPFSAPDASSGSGSTVFFADPRFDD